MAQNQHQRKAASSIFNFTPIGGVGEIGSNFIWIQGQKNSFIIDCGILFPDENLFELKYLVANYNILPDAPEKIIITHGHQDHIGAVYHFCKKFPETELWSPPFAAELIRDQFKRLKFQKEIHIYKESDTISTQDFFISPVHVNHSIPETFGLHITDHKKNFSAFYVSDFKVDNKTPYERYFDFKKLQKLSKGIDKKILLCDSTNILVKGKTLSENDTISGLDQAILETKKNAYITLFSSNIHRVQTIINICKKRKKKLTFLGRSIYSYTDVADKLGFLKDLKDVFINEEQAKSYESGYVALVTGCQGDFFGALRRLSSNEYKGFHLGASDRVIFSSKTIPGNENSVNNIMNQITALGVEIVTERDLPIHASGHAGQKDLEILYKEYAPTDIIPIHGEVFFLRRHVDFIKEVYPQAASYFMNNFSTYSLFKDLKCEVVEKEVLDPIFIHGKNIPIEKESLSERRKMAGRGCVFISVQKDKRNALYLSTSGLPKIATDHLDKLKIHLKRELARSTKEIEEVLRIETKRYFENILGYRPQTFIHAL